MPGKMARSGPQPPFGLPDVPAAIHISRGSCGKARKAQAFTPVRESSGESAMNIAQRIAQNRTDAMAFVGTEGVEPSLTNGDVTVLINALARTVRLADFSSSDRIAVMTPRGKDGLLAFLAISSYATCCPLDPRLTEDELALTLRDLKVVALVDTTGGLISEMSRIRSAYRFAP